MKIEELKIEKCFETLTRAHLGRIACAFEGQPYVVPFNFAYEQGKYLYAFSTLGQKILWMRNNPLVCVEVERIENQNDWTTLVVFGSYEELPDEPSFREEREYAHALLARRPVWWQPAFVAGAHRDATEEIPIYFRVRIEKITGHHGFEEDLQSTVFETRLPS